MNSVEKAKAIKLYDSGKSLQRVGLIMGFCAQTILNNLRSQKIQRRPLKIAHAIKYLSIETRRKMCKSRKKRIGNKSPAWRGDNASIGAGHVRCETMYPAIKCELCGDIRTENKNLHRHHRDKNPLNNAPENVQILCANCHNKIHREKNCVH